MVRKSRSVLSLLGLFYVFSWSLFGFAANFCFVAVFLFFLFYHHGGADGGVVARDEIEQHLSRVL